MTFASIRKRLKAATPGLKTVECCDAVYLSDRTRYEIRDEEHLVAFYEDNHETRIRAKFNAELYANATNDIETLLNAIDILSDALADIKLQSRKQSYDYAKRAALTALSRVEELAGEKER